MQICQGETGTVGVLGGGTYVQEATTRTQASLACWFSFM